MEDILKGLMSEGFKPEVIEDEGGFEPVKGKYVVRIDSAGRRTGVSERTGRDYDFRTVKMQVCEIVSGDKATNRFFDLVYNTDVEGTKRLLNDLFTAGIEVRATEDVGLDAELETLVDKTMNVRAWVAPRRAKQGDEWVNVEPREDVQRLKIVKDFRGNSKKQDSIKSNVPF